MNDKLKEKLRRWAPRLGYPVFYVFCLILFFSWTFPYEKLKDRIVLQFNAQQRNSPSPQELQIEELDSYFFTGVKAKNVKLVSPSADPSKPPTEIKIDEARARVSILSYVFGFGTKDVSFRIDAFDGTIKGSFEDSGKERNIDVTFDAVDMSKIDAITAGTGFPVSGRLNGTIKLLLPEGKASKGSGNVNLEIKDMNAGTAKELTVKTPLGPFTLPQLKVGTFTITGEAKEGTMKITKIGATGGDVDVNGDGRVQMREVATDAHLDVNLKFKINDSYRKKNEKTKMLFGSPDSKEKPMLEMDPRMAKSKSPDGYYALRVGGTLAKPDVQPGGGGVATGLPGSGSSGGAGAGGFNFK